MAVGATVEEETDLGTLIVRAQEAAKRRAFGEARADYERALARLGPDDPQIPVRAGLGWVLHQSGELEGALAQYDGALAHLLRTTPEDANSLRALHDQIATVLAGLGRHEDALRFYRLMLERAARPERLRTLGRAAEAARAAGLTDEAERLEGAMLDEMRAGLPASAPMLAGSLTTIGMTAVRAGRPAVAEKALREAVSLRPDLGHATQALILILLRGNRMEEARSLAVTHYGRKSFWTTRTKKAARATLLTVVALHGNIPEQHLLARLGFAMVVWQIEFGPGHENALPPFDLVLTQVADPDNGQVALERAAEFAGRCGTPVLNDPATVLRTRRDLIPGLLAGIEGLVIPGVVRLPAEADAEAALEACGRLGLAMPVILRGAGRHGGDTVALASDADEVRRDWVALGPRDGTYVTAFKDYRSADGFFRKYRVIFIDRAPMPYHLAISTHWLVHYYSADMQAHAWKVEEEMRFLRDMEGALGARATAALREIGRRMDLDYCGIDFGLTPEGDVLLFEANATMLVHPESADGVLSAKNPFIDRILHAFDALVLRRLTPHVAARLDG